ncbi:hypothetical protein HPB51_002914 [Rhipicephalus microplus]|uniref:Uncharacterized protein n=1 Tax=Rhipicephalus microplus TaxID=6941 RepID=A0A9J6DT41_RHIMP|nr:hypothetical protein HPB51_002914 [Rhipicephalus microplus]
MPPQAAFEVVRAGSFTELPRDHTTQSEDGRKSSKFKRHMEALSSSASDNLGEYLMEYLQPVWGTRHLCEDDPISAVSGLNPKGFVAIDDVSVSETACEELTRSNEGFYCGNKTINIERVCDFVTDCDDGADEKDCGQCDFNESSCGWKNHSLTNMGPTSWRREAIGSVENSPQTGSDGSRHDEEGEEVDAKCRQCMVEERMEQIMVTQSDLLMRITELENVLATRQEKTRAKGEKLKSAEEALAKVNREAAYGENSRAPPLAVKGQCRLPYHASPPTAELVGIHLAADLISELSHAAIFTDSRSALR